MRQFASVYNLSMRTVGSSIVALALLGCSAKAKPPPAPPTTPSFPGLPPIAGRPSCPGCDVFGVRMLYPSLAGGMAWSARWHESPRRFGGQDPLDRWFDAAHGDASYFVPGDGTLRISGPVPRMYVHDPALDRQWRDVEITVYFARLSDDGVPWGGMVSVARTNHGTTGDEGVDKCDTRGLGARMRYDGAIDFEKETNHPESQPRASQAQWAGGLPFGMWLGYKHVVYDLPGGRVRQELWLDESDGAQGGQFRLLNALEDDGAAFGAGQRGCRPGIAPELPLRAAGERPGSESGKPNISVYFRSDRVGRDGLVYKWASVREIQAPAAPPPEPTPPER
jgi:hypothetical protein